MSLLEGRSLWSIDRLLNIEFDAFRSLGACEEGPVEALEQLFAHDGMRIPVRYRPQKARNVPLGTVILAHGITADKSECGNFDQQAKALNEIGFATVQFDFRGHGESKVPSKNMTIAGEVDDLISVLETIADEHLFLIAASFGTVATCLLPLEIKRKISALVLWNPVISLESTFIRPELAWQLRNFGEDRIKAGIEQGKLSINDAFEVGRAFLKELFGPEPSARLHDFDCPILILHGDADTCVSFDRAEKMSEELGHSASFIRVAGSEHGFKRPEEGRLVVGKTTAFILSVI